MSRLGTNLTCRLPDGRTLGYAEFGCPNGRPLMWFHGFPMSRLDGWAADRIARRRGIRVIAPDRPGFGLSTFQPSRRIVDWPADVKALADHIGIKRFAVLGLSGGGPYAVACAYALPEQTMTACGVLIGGPPWEAGPHYMPWFARLTSWASNYCPTVLQALSAMLIGSLRWIMTTGWATKKLDAFLERLSKERRETEAAERAAGNITDEPEPEISAADRRQRAMANWFGGFDQGSKAFVQEARLLSAPTWGFRLEDVEYDKVQIWHGAKDFNSPIEMMRYLAKRLQHADLHEYRDDNHFTMFERLDAVINALMHEDA
ncbi:uncharacterized protein E0L32_006797 [Thyridium curvatum]|uniref:AB hydrolase-1 domain-containing protein n=1 Tax=Thyridium curvatum TaxID=1093900 RepID=A0A507AZG8_9PEZI|nr:uncharacterized protein E0L32_006797 [Thyridium curvatum]TPX12917.1 hypothetical protein E0L32_006797 [Thyridium curvatum]